MTDLIEAADALAEEIEIRLENGCEICNGDCSAANPPVQSCPQQRRTKLLTAYRQARESAYGVKVKPLVWHASHIKPWNGDSHTVPTGYTVRCADENGWKWATPLGAFGFQSSPEAAKAAAQADYEARIKAALDPND